MSEACVHCALQEALDKFAAERAKTPSPPRMSEALYALGVVYRDLLASVEDDERETATLFFQAGATSRPTASPGERRH